MKAARIDIHSHFFGESVLRELRRRGDECETPLRSMNDGRLFVDTPERPYGPITSAFFDITLRLEFLDRYSISQQVLTPPPFLFYYWTSANAAHSLMEMENDTIADVVHAYPGRFLGFATVMLQDVPASIRECERAKSLGLLGIEIGSNVHGLGLEEQRFWPFYEAVESLGLAILIHPNNVAGAERMTDFHLRNLVGFPVDTTLAAAKLIFSSVLDRFPRLRICLGQAGGFLPYIIGRLDAGFNARPECQRNIAKPPSQYLRRFYYDSIIHSADTLRFLIKTVGSDRVMLGTDYPFDMSSKSPVVEVELQTDLKSDERDQVYWGTASQFLALGESERAERQ